MGDAYIFIFGILVGVSGAIFGVLGYIKFFMPAQKAEPKTLPVESQKAQESKPVPELTIQSGNKRKTYTQKTAKENYRAITIAKLPSKSLLNNEEKIVFQALSGFIERWNNNDKNPKEARSLLLLAQVSLGEFIGLTNHLDEWKQEEKDAYFALHSRRADFLIVDSDYMPILIIEHQGSGHFQGDWERKDKEKMTAYGYAGIPVVETYSKAEGSRKNHLEETHIIGGLVAGKLNEKYNLKAS